MNRLLGKLPAKNDPRTLQARRYLGDQLPAPPATLDLTVGVDEWPMYGNDRLGDCTCAAVGHMIQTWTNAAGQLRTPADADIENFYIPVTGSDDTGRAELDVLKTWQKVGVAGDYLGAFTAVNVSDLDEVRQTAYVFNGLYIGVQLPQTAQGEPGWDVEPGAGPAAWPGSWGGHAVDVVGYDDQGVTVITWGQPLRMTWAFWHAYVDEAYALVSRDILNGQGETPEGLDLDQLNADLAAL